ncbi:hypothetical protein [Coprobacter fastidiosus]|uniref:hypothetical protein n=1 Tax=Coprobacter fastidiosus TaxID=1099853 RepID=UPI001DD8B4D4|nr:hypothetical protein [Coprobacter fastidiosus]HJF42555.1 hypothetical protein [Coprobacter fastidiosus]
MKKTILKITVEDYSGSKSIVTVEENNGKYLSCIKFFPPIGKDTELYLPTKMAFKLSKMLNDLLEN